MGIASFVGRHPQISSCGGMSVNSLSMTREKVDRSTQPCVKAIPQFYNVSWRRLQA